MVEMDNRGEREGDLDGVNRWGWTKKEEGKKTKMRIRRRKKVRGVNSGEFSENKRGDKYKR